MLTTIYFFLIPKTSQQRGTFLSTSSMCMTLVMPSCRPAKYVTDILSANSICTYRDRGIYDAKGSVCFVLKFSLPPFSSVMQISRQNSLDIINTSTPVELQIGLTASVDIISADELYLQKRKSSMDCTPEYEFVG